MYYLYILRCNDQTLYTGITNDIDKRVATHNQGKASRYTRVRLPVKVVYVEECGSRSLALKREYLVKKLSKPEKEKMVQRG
jgi:putative endonuclease